MALFLSMGKLLPSMQSCPGGEVDITADCDADCEDEDDDDDGEDDDEKDEEDEGASMDNSHGTGMHSCAICRMRSPLS